MILLSSFLFALAAAATCDKYLAPSLITPDSRKLDYVRSILRTIISLFLNRGAKDRLIRLSLIFVLIVSIQYFVLSQYDKTTAYIVYVTIISNSSYFFVVFIASLTVSIWSYNQSLFFIRIANSTISLIGMIYIFISDLILSAIIFIIGISVIISLYAYTLPVQREFSTSLLIVEECRPDCTTRVEGFFDGENYSSLFLYPSTGDNVQEWADFLKNDINVTRTKFLESTEIDLLYDHETERVESYDKKRKSVIGFVRLELDVSDLEFGFWDIFTFQVKNQIEEIWQHFRHGFNYYSFQKVSYGIFDYVDYDRHKDFALLLSETLQKEVGLKEDIARAIMKSNQGEIEDILENSGISPSEAARISRQVYFLIQFQFTKGFILEKIGKASILRDENKSIYESYVDENKEYQYGGVRVGSDHIPVTTLLIASISFSSLFFIFLTFRVMVWALSNPLSARIGVFSQKFPFTSAVFVLGILSMLGKMTA